MVTAGTRLRGRDAETLLVQMGREPRGQWRTAVRCGHGFPQVIATAPTIEATTPFPTLFWLTCPALARQVSACEAAGDAARWAERLASDASLARRQMAADDAYRAARGAEGAGFDPCAGVGMAGQRDPLATKCLHAHVAAYLADIDDAVGAGVCALLERECRTAACGARTPSGVAP